jgi:acyl-homoserine lactone synthase
MLLIVKGNEHSKHSSVFNQMFQLRHEVFVKERGWSLPSYKGLEIDQYDTSEAVYFVNFNDDGSIESSVRMTPTVNASLMADYFPHLVETGESARSPAIYEATRFIVRPATKTRGDIKKAKARLMAPLVEWCIDKGLTHFQTVIDKGSLSGYVEVTQRTQILGLAHPYGGGRDAPGGGECLALRWPASKEVLADVYAYGGDLIPEFAH